MNTPPPVPVERAISIYIQNNCTWGQVSHFLREETGHFWNPATINSAVNRFRAGIPQRSIGWTDEKIELLRKLWAERERSAPNIAIEIGGLTRNAVIGMVHRLGLPRRAKSPPPPPAKKPRPRNNFNPSLKQRVPPPPRVPYLPPETKEYILGAGKKLLDLADHGECKWALNEVRDAADYFFCGEKTGEGLPYCPHHSARAYSRTSTQVVRDTGERLKKRLWS